MTEREILIKKISSYQFMIEDMRLYLDTHPYDIETVKRIRACEEVLAPLVETYESKFGALFKSNNESNRWSWIKSPWPWESEEDD